MNFTNLKAYLHQLVENGSTPSVDCMVYQNHEPCFRYFEGSTESMQPMEGNELYIIYSMTKMLTCTAALQLTEQGKFSLDDPISLYLPEFAEMQVSREDFDVEAAAKITTGQAAGETGTAVSTGAAKTPITVRHLFSMAAGLDYDLQAPAVKQTIAKGKGTTREVVRALSETVLGFEPGTRFRYSLCHDVLGALIEIWSGQSLGAYMEQHLFTPLGMRDTFFDVPRDTQRLSRMMPLYWGYDRQNPKKEPLQNGFNITPQYESGGAGLTSCTADYALFLDALACGGVGKTGARILTEASVQLMATNQMRGRQIQDFHKLRMGYGYGLGVRIHEDPETSGSLSPVGEFGWDGAAGGFSMVDPIDHISLTYFQHVFGWDLKIHMGMRNALYQDLHERENDNV